jgi:hypothetical protein
MVEEATTQQAALPPAAPPGVGSQAAKRNLVRAKLQKEVATKDEGQLAAGAEGGVEAEDKKFDETMRHIEKFRQDILSGAKSKGSGSLEDICSAFLTDGEPKPMSLDQLAEVLKTSFSVELTDEIKGVIQSFHDDEEHEDGFFDVASLLQYLELTPTAYAESLRSSILVGAEQIGLSTLAELCLHFVDNGQPEPISKAVLTEKLSALNVDLTDEFTKFVSHFSAEENDDLVHVANMLDYLQLWPKTGDEEEENEAERALAQHVRQALILSAQEKGIEDPAQLCATLIAKEDPEAPHTLQTFAAALASIDVAMTAEIKDFALQFVMGEEGSEDNDEGELELESMLDFLQLTPRSHFNNTVKQIRNVLIQSARNNDLSGPEDLCAIFLGKEPLDDDEMIDPEQECTRSLEEVCDSFQALGIQPNEALTSFLMQFQKEGEGAGIDVVALLTCLKLWPKPVIVQMIVDKLLEGAQERGFETPEDLQAVFQTEGPESAYVAVEKVMATLQSFDVEGTDEVKAEVMKFEVEGNPGEIDVIFLLDSFELWADDDEFDDEDNDSDDEEDQALFEQAAEQVRQQMMAHLTEAKLSPDELVQKLVGESGEPVKLGEILAALQSAGVDTSDEGVQRFVSEFEVDDEEEEDEDADTDQPERYDTLRMLQFLRIAPSDFDGDDGEEEEESPVFEDVTTEEA